MAAASPLHPDTLASALQYHVARPGSVDYHHGGRTCETDAKVKLKTSLDQVISVVSFFFENISLNDGSSQESLLVLRVASVLFFGFLLAVKELHGVDTQVIPIDFLKTLF